jgi:hypothetical protein
MCIVFRLSMVQPEMGTFCYPSALPGPMLDKLSTAYGSSIIPIARTAVHGTN